MEQIFHSKDIKKKLEVELSGATKSMKIITAFCKLDALEFIEKSLHSECKEKKILVRFRLDDIISGVTDIEIYKYSIKNGWKVYFDLDLHSKIYVFNNSKVILGSANLTCSGIGLNNHQNIESVACIDINDVELTKIDKLFNNSVELTESIYEKMVSQINKNNDKILKNNLIWDKSITSLFDKKVHVMWVTDMLFSKSPFELNEHDKALLGINENDSVYEIRNKFKKSKPYLWLRTVINSEIYFGELTAKLHNSLIDDPKPYRKDVKTLLSNLLNWISELVIEDVIIDVPNYSQRIKIIS